MPNKELKMKKQASLENALAQCQCRIRARDTRIENLKTAMWSVIEEVGRRDNGLQNPFSKELIAAARRTLQESDPV